MGSRIIAATSGVRAASRASTSPRGTKVTSNGVRGKAYHVSDFQVRAAAPAVRPWKAPSTAMTRVRFRVAEGQPQGVLVGLGAAVDQEGPREPLRPEAHEALAGPGAHAERHGVALEEQILRLPGERRDQPRDAGSRGAPPRGRRRNRSAAGRRGSPGSPPRPARARRAYGRRPAAASGPRPARPEGRSSQSSRFRSSSSPCPQFPHPGPSPPGPLSRPLPPPSPGEGKEERFCFSPPLPGREGGGGGRGGRGVRAHSHPNPGTLSPAVSGRPRSRFIHWIAPPAAPLTRLSMAEKTTR